MSNHQARNSYRQARYEAIVVILIWAAALAYTVTYCWWHGYTTAEPPAAHEMEFVCGFPSWVFWGIIVPWLVCWVICYWFSYHFMRDDDLGEEAEPDAPRAESEVHSAH
jgi:hypothetical protein